MAARYGRFMSVPTLDRLVALEHEGWESLCDSRGGTFYGAALVYRARAVRGDSEPFVALMSSTYRMISGVPRLAPYQQTTITH